MVRDALKAAVIPSLLSIYAIAWIAIQPLVIIQLRRFSAMFRYNYILLILSQIVTTILFLVVNALWLLSWYKISRKIRSKLISK